MDDYTKEIADLRREVERLIEAEGDPQEIAELEMQIRVLKALYAKATALLDQGREDDDLRGQPRIRGYGDWNLDTSPEPTLPGIVPISTSPTVPSMWAGPSAPSASGMR